MSSELSSCENCLEYYCTSCCGTSEDTYGFCSDECRLEWLEE